MTRPFFLLAVCLFAAGLAPAQDRFESEIKAFEAADIENPPGAVDVLLAGSSTFRLWPDPAHDLAGFSVLNRGFGGSHMDELLHYAERIVLPYKARVVLVYEGDNDLFSNKSPETVLEQFKAFVALLDRHAPGTHIGFVSVKPSPKRERVFETQQTFNQMVADFCQTRGNLGYIDIFTPLLGEDGKPDPVYFVEDMLHMSAKGYEVLTTAATHYLSGLGNKAE